MLTVQGYIQTLNEDCEWRIATWRTLLRVVYPVFISVFVVLFSGLPGLSMCDSRESRESMDSVDSLDCSGLHKGGGGGAKEFATSQ